MLAICIFSTRKGNLYALDKNTGIKNWTFTTNDNIDYTADDIESSPFLSGDTIYISETKFLLHAVDINTGELKWSYRTALPNPSPPVIDENNIYISTWTSGGMVGESTKGELYAVSAANGELLWSLNIGIGFSAPPLVNEGTVYVGSWDGKMHAVESVSGELLWSFDAGNILPGQASVSDGKLLFASYYCLEGTCTGSGEIDNHANTLIALNSQDGSEIWRFSDK